MSLITRGLASKFLITRGLGAIIDSLVGSGLRISSGRAHIDTYVIDQPDTTINANQADQLIKSSRQRLFKIDTQDRS
tara:strand:- start:106 stop:336 length:231 start_codon:yes stop_codon:yes gene_type:complete